MSRFTHILLVLMVPLALALAWGAGQVRQKSEKQNQLNHISSEIQGLAPISNGLYKGHFKDAPDQELYVAHSGYPSYGGVLRTAVVVDSRKIIRHVAVLDSDDTRSYLERVVEQAGILDNYTGKSLDALPRVDGISGATLSSTAIIQGVEASARKIGTDQFGMPGTTRRAPAQATPETEKLVLICLFFAGAFFISRKGFPHRKKARTALLLISTLTLGFWLGAQFSLSTVATLISGTWLRGMATYAALLCLVLAVVLFLVTKKSLLCLYLPLWGGSGTAGPDYRLCPGQAQKMDGLDCENLGFCRADLGPVFSHPGRCDVRALFQGL